MGEKFKYNKISTPIWKQWRSLLYQNTGFKKTSSSAPVFVYYTVHYDDKGGDMNTYPKDFINQVYILAYGIIGDTDHVDSEVYDAHQAFEIDKTKMKMLVPLDMNNNAIKNVGNLSNIILHGIQDSSYFFTISSIRLKLEYSFITDVTLYTPYKYRLKQAQLALNIGRVNDVIFPFTFGSRQALVNIQINRYFARISAIHIADRNEIPLRDISFRLEYKMFH